MARGVDAVAADPRKDPECSAVMGTTLPTTCIQGMHDALVYVLCTDLLLLCLLMSPVPFTPSPSTGESMYPAVSISELSEREQ